MGIGRVVYQNVKIVVILQTVALIKQNNVENAGLKILLLSKEKEIQTTVPIAERKYKTIINGAENVGGCTILVKMLELGRADYQIVLFVEKFLVVMLLNAVQNINYFT